MSKLGLIPEDMTRKTLWWKLVHEFRRNGYADSQASSLADIAIGPVASALQVAHEAYKLNLEAIQTVGAKSIRLAMSAVEPELRLRPASEPGPEEGKL